MNVKYEGLCIPYIDSKLFPAFLVGREEVRFQILQFLRN